MEKLNIKIETLSPIYIGGAAEKNFQGGLDIFQEKNRLYYVPIERLAPHLDHRITQLLAKGKKEEFQKALQQKGVDFKNLAALQWKNDTDTSPQEVRAFIRNGNGLPFIPGSSLKGAISSHILKKLKPDFRGEQVDKATMRHIQVADSYFQETAILPSKVFSLTGPPHNLHGAWKNRRSGSVNSFNPNQFTTHYEVLSAGQVGFGRIKLANKENFDFPFPPSYKNLNLNQENGLQVFFTLINQNTKSYLEKEIEFFDTYTNRESENIKEKLESLLQEVPDNDSSAILRLGGGSGFHSITGDWQFESHQINGYGRRNRGQLNRKDSAKTRKLAFQKENDRNYDFLPFGFIKLSIAQENEAEGYQRKLAKKKVAIKEEATVKAEPPKPKEPPKPVTKNFEDLKDRDKVDAEVLRQEGMYLIVKLFVAGMEEQEWKTRYPAGMEKGTLIEVGVNIQGKNEKKKIANLTAPRKK